MATQAPKITKWMTKPSSMCYGKYAENYFGGTVPLIGGGECIKGNVILSGYKVVLPAKTATGVPVDKEFLYYGKKTSNGKRIFLSGNVVDPHSDRPDTGKGNFSGVDGGSSTPPIVTVLPSILSGIGFIWGLSYAFSKEKKFWGYIGYSFLGSIGGATLGSVAVLIANPQAFSKSSSLGADGAKKKKWSLFKSKVKGSCTCPDGQRYPCTGERSCNECCHKFLD